LLNTQEDPINSGKNLTSCILWGASTILVSTALKLTPDRWVEKIPIHIDEDKGVDPNDKWMAAYNKQAQAKISDLKVSSRRKDNS